MNIIAKHTRKYIEEKHLQINLPFIHSFPKSCCEIVTILLGKVYYEINKKHNINIISGYDRDEDECHYWLTVNDLVFDITADQFSEIEFPIYGDRNEFIFNKFSLIEKHEIIDIFKNNSIYLENKYEIDQLSLDIIKTK